MRHVGSVAHLQVAKQNKSDGALRFVVLGKARPHTDIALSSMALTLLFSEGYA